jgi:20S proteasome alpha/beta subunit
MTIALGLCCSNGIVLASDREITHDETKTEKRKAYVVRRPGCEVGVVGAGGLDMIIYAVQELERALSPHHEADAVRVLLDAIAADLFERYIKRESGHSFELLVGIKTDRELRLAKVSTGAPTIWIDEHECVGMGTSIAQYVLAELFERRDALPVSRGIALAVHVVRLAKRHAKYCGGETDVVYLARGLHADHVSMEDVNWLTQSSKRFAAIVKPVMMALTDINVPERQLDDVIGRMSAELHAFRPNDYFRIPILRSVDARAVSSPSALVPPRVAPATPATPSPEAPEEDNDSLDR